MAKSTANLRGYLDIENQKINPTIKIEGKRSSVSPKKSKENPAMTLKF